MDNFDDYQPPDLSHMSTDDLCQLLLMTGDSRDASDKKFAQACRNEIAKRKPDDPRSISASIPTKEK